MNTFKPCPFCEAAQSENERLRDTNQALERDIYNAEMNLKHITAELAESQRREKAVVDALLKELSEHALELHRLGEMWKKMWERKELTLNE